MTSEKDLQNLLEEYKFKIEMHCHSNPASPCADFSPEEVVHIYSEIGYDAIVLTNHLNFGLMKDGESAKDYVDRYMEDYYRAAEEAERTGLTLIYGIEARFTENSNDYLVYGVDGQETRNLFPNLATGLSDFRKKNHNDNMIFIQAHPCRHGCLRMEPSLLDGVEVINLHPHHNSMLGFAAKYAKEVGGIIVSGSDFHHPGTAGLGGIYTKTLPGNTFELADILRSGDYLLNLGGLPVIPRYMRK